MRLEGEMKANQNARVVDAEDDVVWKLVANGGSRDAAVQHVLVASRGGHSRKTHVELALQRSASL